METKINKARGSGRTKGGLREKGKEDRRNSILEAAKGIILKTGSTDFSMNELADSAGVSMKTAYNLLNSKSTILYLLLEGALGKIESHPLSREASTDVQALIDLAEVPIGVFTGVPGFYRPLLRYLLGAQSFSERPQFMARAFHFWLTGLRAFEKHYHTKVPANALALNLHTYFAGALDLWIQEEIDAEDFRRHMRNAISMILLPHVGDDERPILLAHIDAFEATAAAYEVNLLAHVD